MGQPMTWRSALPRRAAVIDPCLPDRPPQGLVGYLRCASASSALNVPLSSHGQHQTSLAEFLLPIAVSACSAHRPLRRIASGAESPAREQVSWIGAPGQPCPIGDEVHATSDGKAAPGLARVEFGASLLAMPTALPYERRVSKATGLQPAWSHDSGVAAIPAGYSGPT